MIGINLKFSIFYQLLIVTSTSAAIMHQRFTRDVDVQKVSTNSSANVSDVANITYPLFIMIIACVIVLIIAILILVIKLLECSAKMMKSKKRCFPPLLEMEKQPQNTPEAKDNFEHFAAAFHGNAAIEWENNTTKLDLQLTQLPYQKRYEIPFDKIEIKKPLACGDFGVVSSGFLKKTSTDGIFSTERLSVAIKTPLNNFDFLQVKMLSDELKIMCAVGKHPNVMALVGAATRDIKFGQLYVVVEMCENGDLLNYLRTIKKRGLFVDELQTKNPDGDNEYQKRKSEDNTKHNHSNTSQQEVTTSDLDCLALQIANGMEYLSKFLVHRDLAARNVLLTKNNICRIGDFGLARRYENKEYYRVKKSKGQKVPLPWLPIEAISDLKYTEASDVWAFGCVLYEIYTLGTRPYADIPIDMLQNHILEGNKNDKPQYAHDDMYDLMMSCWADEAEDRPTFSNCVYYIKEHIRKHSPEKLEQLEINLTKEGNEQRQLGSWLQSTVTEEV